MHDFLESQRLAHRFRKFVLPSVILLAVVVAGAAGFYFYQKHQSNPAPTAKASTSQVAGAQATTAAAQQLPQDWVLKYFHTANENDPKVGGAAGDPDHDFLSNYQEYIYGTDPTKADTDGDGSVDGAEVALGRSPLGSGDLVLTNQETNYLQDLVNSNQDYAKFSQDNIQKQLTQTFQPDRAVVMDFPQDSEIVIINQNDQAALESYYNSMKALTVVDPSDLVKMQNGLLGLSQDDLNNYITKLQITVSLLEKVPVPSGVVNIQKLKIAELRAGIRMFELVRDEYQNGTPAPTFWSDLFYQTVIAQNSAALQVVGWQQVGQLLRDKGGI